MRNLSNRRCSAPRDEKTIAQIFQKIFSRWAVLVLLQFLFSPLFGQTLTVTPQKPMAGDTIFLNYDPKGGKFEKDTLKMATVIVFEGLNSETKKIPLEFSNGVYLGKFPTESSSLLLAIAFGQNKIWDKTPMEGRFYPFYKNGMMVEGARIVMADFYTNTTGKTLYGFDNDYQKVVDLLKTEMQLFPKGLYQTRTLEKYYQAVYKLDSVKGKAEILAYVAQIDKQQQLADVDYYKKFRLYEILGMNKEAEQAVEMITIKFPNSPIIFAKRYKDILTPQPAQQMEVLGNKLISDYDMTRSSLKDFLGSVYASIAQAYLKDLNFKKFNEYLLKTNQNVRSINLATAAAYLASKKETTAAAQGIAKWNVELVDSLIATSKGDKKPVYLLQRQIEGKSSLGQIYFHQRNYDAALPLLKEANEGSQTPSFENSFYYALSLMNTGDYQLAKSALETIISRGKTGAEVVQAYKEAHSKSGGNVDSYHTDLARLLTEGKSAKKAELAKIMMNKPAPGFTLLDQHGKQVKLSDYAGKVVVLDFWASWCIPCLQAFPGMQKLVKKYAAAKDVVFLFVNTSEKTGKDRAKNISTYLAKNKFDFRVLLDEKQANQELYLLQSKYGATSIPLKVVIDGKGIIRFQSVGYLGSDESVVEELSELIEMVRNGE